jgi:hypothetical protein
MKIFKYSFGLLVSALVLLSSCRDFVEPNVPYATFDTGTYLRTISRGATTFSLADLSSAKLALTLEAVDIEDGATVETVEIRVRRRRLITGVGLEYVPTTGNVSVKALANADFKPNTQSRFLRATFEVTATETLAALKLVAEDNKIGDVFEYQVILTDKKGRKFDSKNVTTNIAGSPFYASPFQYFQTVAK